jgi:hypothetical protein
MSDGPRTPKEALYDEQISPLMRQIIALCKEHKINMVADFSLGYDPEADETLFCTTALPEIDPGDQKGAERMMRAYQAMRSPPQLLAFTITRAQ